MYSIQTASTFIEAIHEVIKLEMLNNTLRNLKHIVTLLANSYTLPSGFLYPSALKGEIKIYCDCKGFVHIHVNNFLSSIISSCSSCRLSIFNILHICN